MKKIIGVRKWLGVFLVLCIIRTERISASFSYDRESLEGNLMTSDEPLYETLYTLPPRGKRYTELPGGLLLSRSPTKVLDKAGSPYLVLNDWIVERGAELRIDPGVEVKFKPTVGLTVRGRLLAIVSVIYLITIFLRFELCM